MRGPPGEVESEAEDCVGEKTVKPSGGGARRARGGNVCAHSGLHQEEGRQHGDNANQQRGTERGALQPREAPDAGEQGRERGTNQVVRHPSDHEFARHRRRSQDGMMPESSTGHVGNPATDQAVVGSGVSEEPLSRHAP